MENWILAVVPICLIILAVAICLLCERCSQRRSQDELIYNDYSSYAASRNFGYDVESQRRTQRSANHTVQSQNREQRNVNYYVESERRAQRSVNHTVQSQNRGQRNINYDVESQKRAQRKVNHDVKSQRRAASDGETELFKSVKAIYFETSTGYPKLDLHNYTLSNAMTILKIFLQISIAEYKSNNHIRHKRFILVITGKGLHSPNGIPIIKPAVESYLKAHGYTYNWSNPGMARIDLLPFKERD